MNELGRRASNPTRADGGGDGERRRHRRGRRRRRERSANVGGRHGRRGRDDDIGVHGRDVLRRVRCERKEGEHPDGGDYLRDFGPQVDGTGLWWKHLGRNKRSVTLNLKSDAGKAVFRDIVGGAELLIENFQPDTFERWGLGYDALSELNEELVMLRIS